MATKTSVGSGAWTESATWGTTPPSTGDYAIIDTGHTVIVNDVITIWKILVKGVMSVVSTHNITFDDTAAAGITVDSGGSVVITGTQASPVVFSSAGGTNPTNHWSWYGSATPGTQTIDYLHLTGHAWTLGNSTTSIRFNTDSANRITNVFPIERTAIIDEHVCLGRTGGRVYPRASHAGIVKIVGYFYWPDMYWMVAENLKGNRTQCSFSSEYVQLPSCHIESIKYEPRPGKLHIPFTMTLIEDV